MARAICRKRAPAPLRFGSAGMELPRSMVPPLVTLAISPPLWNRQDKPVRLNRPPKHLARPASLKVLPDTALASMMYYAKRGIPFRCGEGGESSTGRQGVRAGAMNVVSREAILAENGWGLWVFLTFAQAPLDVVVFSLDTQGGTTTQSRIIDCCLRPLVG